MQIFTYILGIFYYLLINFLKVCVCTHKYQKEQYQEIVISILCKHWLIQYADRVHQHTF